MKDFVSRDQKMVRRFLPCLSDEDYKLIQNLPENFVLQVPYYQQEEKHFCGAACVQMMYSWLGLSIPSQTEIAELADWTDWQTFNHATFKERLIVFLMNQGQLPVNYYPQTYVATQMNDGLKATNFIRNHGDLFCYYDFQFFKAQLVKTRNPLFLRVHFNEDIYPMDENMLIKYDNAGHCILMIGYDKDGFIFHDPWNKALWGGTGGGEYRKITYDQLMYEFNLVNYTLDSPTGSGFLSCRINPPRQAVVTNSEIELVAEINWNCLCNVFGNKPCLKNVTMELSVGEGFEIIGNNQFVFDNDIYPGNTCFGSWKLSTKELEGSYPVQAVLNATAFYPEIPWEDMPETQVAYSRIFKNRICIFNSSYLSQAGIF